MEMTDIVDLLGESDLRRTLMQCGVNAERFSHYELFRAFCESQPLLSHHRLQSRFHSILRAFPAPDCHPSDAYCNEIWRHVAEALLLEPPSQKLLFAMQCDRGDDEKSITVEDAMLCLREQTYSANRLLSTHADSWEAWREEINGQLNALVGQAYNGVLYRLPKYYRDCSPNPYTVGQILKKERRSLRDRSLLHAQLLRQILAFCREKGLRVILLSQCDNPHLRSLLHRLKGEVGLPALACSAANDAPEWLLDFTAENREVTLAVAAEKANTHGDCLQTLTRLSRAYPLGRVTVVR